MNADEIKRIEEELQIVLPAGHKHFLENFPGALRERGEDYGGYGYTLDSLQLLGNADDLIAINRGVKDYLSPLEETGDWPSHCFVVGHDACGNYFFVDLRLEDSPVYYWFHEDDSTCEVAPTIRDYADELIRDSSYLAPDIRRHFGP